MSISLNFDEEQSARLEERARELGVDARELAKAAVNDLLSRPADDFERAAKFVLDEKPRTLSTAEMNGYELSADVDDAGNVILTLAAGELPREELLEWVTSNLKRLPT